MSGSTVEAPPPGPDAEASADEWLLLLSPLLLLALVVEVAFDDDSGRLNPFILHKSLHFFKS